MKLTGIERATICAQVLTRGTLRNRYRFWRLVDERTPLIAAVRAVAGWIRWGE